MKILCGKKYFRQIFFLKFAPQMTDINSDRFQNLLGITFVNEHETKRERGRAVVSDWRNWTSSSDFWRLGWRDFFVPTVLLSTFIPFFLTSSPLCLIVLFQSCCSHAQVSGRTLLHEFLFSYSHTEWNLPFLKQTPLWHGATWDKQFETIWNNFISTRHDTGYI